MTITWGRLRRHKDSNKQAAGTAVDEHASPASEKLRERREAQLEARRELLEAAREPANGSPRGAPGGWDYPSGF